MAFLALEKPGCVNCPNACCRKFGGKGKELPMPLNDDEAKLLRSHGTKLKYRGRPEGGRDLRAYYEIIGDCGGLEKLKPGERFRKCKFHGTDDQPLVCGGGFPEGGIGCLERRAAVLKPEIED